MKDPTVAASVIALSDAYGIGRLPRARSRRRRRRKKHRMPSRSATTPTVTPAAIAAVCEDDLEEATVGSPDAWDGEPAAVLSVPGSPADDPSGGSDTDWDFEPSVAATTDEDVVGGVVMVAVGGELVCEPEDSCDGEDEDELSEGGLDDVGVEDDEEGVGFGTAACVDVLDSMSRHGDKQ